MLPDRTDPERPHAIDDRRHGTTAEFEAGLITEAVYRASLHGTGLRGAAIDTEVAIHRPFTTLGDVVAGWVSGLAPDHRGRT